LTGVIPLEYCDAGKVSTAAGILDAAIYLGAALSGPTAGVLIDLAGWQGVMYGWIAVSGVSIVVAFFGLKGK
jgi:sugar phosphate permease